MPGKPFERRLVGVVMLANDHGVKSDSFVGRKQSFDFLIGGIIGFLDEPIVFELFYCPCGSGAVHHDHSSQLFLDDAGIFANPHQVEVLAFGQVIFFEFDIADRVQSPGYHSDLTQNFLDAIASSKPKRLGNN